MNSDLGPYCLQYWLQISEIVMNHRVGNGLNNNLSMWDVVY